MQINKSLAPTELVMLNATKFYKMSNSFQSFPLLELDGKDNAQFVDERRLGIGLLNVSIAANLEGNYVTVNELSERSVLVSDKYSLSPTGLAAAWPEGTLENKLLDIVSGSTAKYLSVAIGQLFSPVGASTPWRELCWDVYRGLFVRGLLTADETEVVHPFDSDKKIKYRGGPYKATPELKKLLEQNYGLNDVAKLIEKYRKERPDWIVAVTHAAENLPVNRYAKV